jgi:hypothetical protein
MPGIFGEQIIGEQINQRSAALARQRLNPEEVFDVGVFAPARLALGLVEPADVVQQRTTKHASSLKVLLQVQFSDLLSDDPPSHWIDIEAGYRAPDAIRLDQGGASTHERIEDSEVREGLAPVERLAKGRIEELRQKQTPKQGPRASSEPFVDCHDGAVILLDLLLTQSQVSHEWHIEVALDHEHGA